MSKRMVVYAPNLHSGGGLVILKDIIDGIPSNVSCRYYLDIRSKNQISLSNPEIVWVKPTFFSRLLAEIRLSLNSRKSDAILLLHSIPPIFFVKGRKILYFQNKLLSNNLVHYLKFAKKIAFRIFIERLLLRTLFHSIDEVMVQTESIKSQLVGRFPNIKNKIVVLPFLTQLIRGDHSKQKFIKYDLIYVASSDHHKNHRNLFEALKILKEEGLNFSLAVTIPPNDVGMIELISQYASNHLVNIDNIGVLSRSSLLDFYLNSRALIYPSTDESFGLPLIEAQYLGVPILAAELDYVRDVCVPKETFDPLSPVSISRAIKRFFNCGDSQNISIVDGPSFVKEFLRRVNYFE